MRKLIPLLLLFVLPFLGCEETMPTGSEDVVVLEGALFSITSKSVVDNNFFVEGTVKNTWNEVYTPTWYMEAQFYTDEDLSIKLGGAVDSFNFSLNDDETTTWSLTYSNSDQNLDNYPDFGVSNFRAYKR